MLRVEIRESADTLILKLEGRLTGDDAERTRKLVNESTADARLLVDLAEVVFIDAAGEGVLAFLGRVGAEFIAPTSYTLDVCERLGLSVARNGNNSQEKAAKARAVNDKRRQDRTEPRKK